MLRHKLLIIIIIIITTLLFDYWLRNLLLPVGFCLNAQHVTAEHTLEVQMSNANRSTAGLEELVRNVEQDKHQLLLDLAAARDLCSRLESAKDGLQRQLVTKALDQEKVM